MKIDSQREINLLSKIGFVRTSGSPEEFKAGDILLKEIASFGINSDIESFSIKSSKIKKASLKVIEPYEKEYTVTAFNCSISTPEDGITTELKYIDNGANTDFTALKNKVVLINGNPRPRLYKKLMEAGIAGFIVITGTFTDEEDKTDIEKFTLRDKVKKYGTVPAFTMRIKDALHLLKNKASKVKIELITEDIELTSRNIIVTLNGSKYPEDIVSFGAHYDSVPYSRGISDNGGGAVIIMELLRYFVENPPARTVKFIWYGSEEIGLQGSQAYLKCHEAELDKHLLMINVDVAGPVIGEDYIFVTADEKVVDYMNKTAAIKGFPADTQQSIYSSDSTAYANAGIPSISFCRQPTDDADYIHTRYDMMDFISAESLEKTSTFIRDFSDAVVNSVVFPIPRIIPDNMRQALDEYFNIEKN